MIITKEFSCFEEAEEYCSKNGLYAIRILNNKTKVVLTTAEPNSINKFSLTNIGFTIVFDYDENVFICAENEFFDDKEDCFSAGSAGRQFFYYCQAHGYWETSIYSDNFITLHDDAKCCEYALECDLVFYCSYCDSYHLDSRYGGLTHSGESYCIDCESEFVDAEFYNSEAFELYNAYENGAYEWEEYYLQDQKKTSLLVGIELELELESPDDFHVHNVLSMYEELNDISIRWFGKRDFVVLAHDSSLEWKGVEFITQPTSINNFTNTRILADILDCIARHGYRALKESNGLHIHLSKNCLTSEQILNVFGIVHGQAKALKALSGRGGSKAIKQYAKFLEADVSKLTDPDYCIEYTDEMEQAENSKCYAVNLQHDNSIEFRFFAATLDCDIITGSVLLCNMIYDLATKKMLFDGKLSMLDDSFVNIYKSNRCLKAVYEQAIFFLGQNTLTPCN